MGMCWKDDSERGYGVKCKAYDVVNEIYLEPEIEELEGIGGDYDD